MPLTPSKGTLVDVNIHTNKDTEVSHKTFHSGRDIYGAVKIGREASLYIDSPETFDRLLQELDDCRREFIAEKLKGTPEDEYVPAS